MARVQKDSHGAVVLFLGTVRNTAEGKEVLRLEYEAFSPLAEDRLQEIEKEVRERWAGEIAIVHRTGKVPVGEIAVAIAVSTPHRKEAFQACSWAIDRLKEVVPLWKKEVLAEGGRWVGT